MTTLLVVLVVEKVAVLVTVFELCIDVAVEPSSGIGIIASSLEANVLPSAMKLTLRGGFRKALVGTLLLKDVEQQFFGLLLCFYCISHLIAEVLTKQLFTRIF